MTIDSALKSMGYRQSRKNIWAKPIGWGFLTFDSSKNKISSWFIGANSKYLLWDSGVYYESEDILTFLKDFEAHKTQFNLCSLCSKSSFEFLTTLDVLDEFL